MDVRVGPLRIHSVTVKPLPAHDLLHTSDVKLIRPDCALYSEVTVKKKMELRFRPCFSNSLSLFFPSLNSLAVFPSEGSQ